MFGKSPKRASLIHQEKHERGLRRGGRNLTGPFGHWSGRWWVTEYYNIMSLIPHIPEEKEEPQPQREEYHRENSRRRNGSLAKKGFKSQKRDNV